MQDYLNLLRKDMTARELADLAAQGGHPVPEEAILEAEQDIDLVNWHKTNAVHKGIESRWRRLRVRQHHFEAEGTHVHTGDTDRAIIDDGNWLEDLDAGGLKKPTKKRGDEEGFGCCVVF